MIKNEVNSISENYFKYLKDANKFKLLDNESIEFYTPILDHFGDSISVNIRKKDLTILFLIMVKHYGTLNNLVWIY